MLEESPICYLFIYVEDLDETRALLEQKMGFKPIETDGFAAKYEAGKTMLALNRARDFGVTISEPRARALIVQHVGDVAAADAALDRAGVKRGPIDRYSIGGTVEILNKERHGLMLYEPSDEALTWPSAAKIRDVLGAEDPAAAKGAHVADGSFDMGERPIIYTFLFVRDAAEAKAFYQDKLGLKPIEVDEGPGVVKYDAGSFIMATHAEDDLGSVGDPPRNAAMASVFLVDDVDEKYAALKARGVEFDSGPSFSEIGKTARFHDPNGHSFFLYEPSEAALGKPSGDVLRKLNS